MRYSAIRIFGDGSFMTSRFYRHAAINSFNVADSSGKLKEYLKEHKYVIVPFLEDTDTRYMLFREEHPMFNLPVLRRRTYEGHTLDGPIHDILKGLLTDFNNNTI